MVEHYACLNTWLNPVITQFLLRDKLPQSFMHARSIFFAEKMGQKLSQEYEKNKTDILIISEVFSQGVVHASQKLKEYVGFEDPLSKFRPAMDTLNEIFLVNFISFCIEKGVEERIMTSKMTKKQSVLLGVDWIWTLSGANKQIKLQIAVQSLQMAELLPNETGCGEEASLTDQLFKNKSRFEKLEEFCTLVGQDCLGLLIMFGVPGKPKDIRGVMLDSINKEKRKNHLSSENALWQFILNTDSFLSTKEMLENCLCKKNGLKEVGKVYINFL